MAGVPLPTCSGGRAIHDPQQGSMVLFLHPVPYAENRKIKLYKLIFKKCSKFLTHAKARIFKRGGPFSFSFYSTIMLSFLKNISNKSIFRNYLDIFDCDIDTN
jgi:hypothetical protein